MKITIALGRFFEYLQLWLLYRFFLPTLIRMLEKMLSDTFDDANKAVADELALQDQEKNK